MSVTFNPFTGRFDFTGSNGTTVVVDDANGVVMLENTIVDGELVVEGDGLAIIKNSISTAFQKIIEQVTITTNGEVLVSSLANLEVSNG